MLSAGAHAIGNELLASSQFGADEIGRRLGDLRSKWETLKAKAGARKQLLDDSLQAQQYLADASEAESWMKEKEPIVGYTDYGKDEDSTEVRTLCTSTCTSRFSCSMAFPSLSREKFDARVEHSLLNGQRGF